MLHEASYFFTKDMFSAVYLNSAMKDWHINLQKPPFIWGRRETSFHIPPDLKVLVGSLKPNIWFLQFATAFHFEFHIFLTFNTWNNPQFFFFLDSVTDTLLDSIKNYWILRFHNNLCFSIKTGFFFLVLTLWYLLWLDSSFSEIQNLVIKS